ncbi:TPA: hypothetical protein DGH83_01185 [Candidatus Peregrinibacteria bacterium]|nr:hypothetical protein [Candidatus Peregrinibacteria bacterium]
MIHIFKKPILSINFTIKVKKQQRSGPNFLTEARISIMLNIVKKILYEEIRRDSPTSAFTPPSFIPLPLWNNGCLNLQNFKKHFPGRKVLFLY